jgi:uridine phosphorylase
MRDITQPESTPLLETHALSEESAFRPEGLLGAVRKLRGLDVHPVPPVCILEFDGDLTDALVADRSVTPFESWACFHTSMYDATVDGMRWGIVPRTIGGPYAVLVAEQLWAAGAKLIVGLSSAGRVSSALPLPSLVVATSAIRDEGTSLHYLPPSRAAECPSPVTSTLAEELATTGWRVSTGTVWTTDAPYRETLTQLRHWAEEGVLAVEMQAASLFAFGSARHAEVALVAVVSNAVDHSEDTFDTGTPSDGRRIAEAIVRAAYRYLQSASD